MIEYRMGSFVMVLEHGWWEGNKKLRGGFGQLGGYHKNAVFGPQNTYFAQIWAISAKKLMNLGGFPTLRIEIGNKKVGAAILAPSF